MSYEIRQINIVYLTDMLEGVSDEISEAVLDAVGDMVAYGDAKYTIITWYKAERAFYDALYWLNMSQEEASSFMSRYKDLGGTDVALLG